jgi:hypothetical protein
MAGKAWIEMSADEKADDLRVRFEAYLDHDAQNLNARAEWRREIEKRLTAIEETLLRMESRLARLERRNDT